MIRLLERGEYCNVLCSHEMGKTSLLVRSKASSWPRSGVRTARIDGSIPPKSADTWYPDLLQEIAHQLGLELNLAEWWQAAGVGHAQPEADRVLPHGG